MAKSKKRFPAFIADGFTRDGFIAEVDGLHEAVRFTYRPVLPMERVEHFAKMNGQPDDKAERATMCVVAGKLSSWNVTDHNDKPVQISELNVGRIVPWNRLYRIVFGLDASDLDPAWSEEQKLKEAELAAAASASGNAPGDEREAQDEKNSGSASG